MTTPTNTISLLDVRTEFGGGTPISLSQYYAGGGIILSTPPTSAFQTGPIPSSGPISLGAFRGLNAISPVALSYASQVDMYDHPNGPWNTSDFISPSSFGANATNLHFILTANGGAPATNPAASYNWWLDVLSTNYYSAVIQNPQTQKIYYPPAPEYGYPDAKYVDNISTPLIYDLPYDTVPVNRSVQDFVVSGDNASRITWYRVNVSDGITTANITFGVGMWW